jgi:hypothetical protein
MGDPAVSAHRVQSSRLRATVHALAIALLALVIMAPVASLTLYWIEMRSSRYVLEGRYTADEARVTPQDTAIAGGIMLFAAATPVICGVAEYRRRRRL